MATWLHLGASIWSFLVFIPYFLILLLLGITKGVTVAPITLIIIFGGNVAVALGLWPAYLYWTYESIIKTQKLGWSLKLVGFICLPAALVLWPTAVVCGSVLVGLGYGFFTPLIATFEAVGEGRKNKLFSCFTDGTYDTIQGSCTVVRDFTDCCYHSCRAYLADIRDAKPVHGPYNIRLIEIPQCFVVAIIGVIMDVPLFALISLIKSPFMLIKGWERLLDDLVVSRDGACVKVACVPFAGLAIILWPLVVVVTALCAVFSSIFVGLYAAVIVHKEKSFKSGLAYIVTMVAEFDEYTNDVLYLREGSCLPRPSYGAHVSSRAEVVHQESNEKVKVEQRPPSDSGVFPQLSASKSLKQSLQEVKMVQIWEHWFQSLVKHCQELVDKGIVTASDIEESINYGDKVKKNNVAVKLPAYSLLKNLIVSAKSGSTGLILCNGLELTVFNKPQNKLMDWFYDPLLILKEQLRAANLEPSEELYMEKIILFSAESNWDNGSVQPEQSVRKGELEALSRRIQGIATSVSRFPTFRRKHETFMKSLLMYAQKKGKNINMSTLSSAEESV